jgi:LysM repeat protein
MKQWKRLAYFLFLNILVSACTVLAVLVIWERVRGPLVPPSSGVNPATVVSMGSASPTALSQPPTPALSPTEEDFIAQNLETYQVQPGDTLGLIAEQFGVAVEDLIKINQIPDPNALPAGMVLYIPRPNAPQPSPTPAPTQTALPASTPNPSSPPQEARVIINAVIGPGDLASERVFITRSGSGELSLAGWQLRDEDGNVFIFPQLILYQEGAVNVWSTSGSNTVVDLYWGLSQPVWRSGEKVTLLDAEGKVRATYTIP